MNAFRPSPITDLDARKNLKRTVSLSNKRYISSLSKKLRSNDNLESNKSFNANFELGKKHCRTGMPAAPGMPDSYQKGYVFQLEIDSL